MAGGFTKPATRPDAAPLIGKMKRFTCLFLSLVALGLVGCSSTSDASRASDDDDDHEPSAKGSGDDDDDGKDADDVANQPPHALGTITLGESHSSTGGIVYPFVTASFVPDVASVQSCTTKLEDDCEFTKAAKCDESCGSGEVCSFNKSCKPTCQKVAVCSKACEDDEFCTLDKAGKATCAKVETFDAGPLAFGGTTTAITLYPPYKFEASGKGAPFLAGAEIKVQAQGATDAGFKKFEETFTATTFLQSKPKLDKVSRADAFGKGSLPISWAPGEDSISVTVAGLGGSVVCKAKDSTGKFAIPRSAINAALGDGTNPYGVPTLSLSLTRQRKETKKGLKTTGKLTSATVQSEAWLDLVTMSTETASIQGCQAKTTACDDGCFDLTTSTANCGACGKTCALGQICSASKCTGNTCTICRETTKTNACYYEWNACNADPNCASTAACLASCTGTAAACAQQCPFKGTFNDDVTALMTCVNQACSTKCP